MGTDFTALGARRRLVAGLGGAAVAALVVASVIAVPPEWIDDPPACLRHERIRLVPGGERRWIPLRQTAGMALTGLARKVLARAHLLSGASQGVIAPHLREDVL